MEFKLLAILSLIFAVGVEAGKLKSNDDYDYNEDWDVQFMVNQPPKVKVEESYDQRQKGSANIRVRLDDISVDGEMDPIKSEDIQNFLFHIFGNSAVSYLRRDEGKFRNSER